MLSSVEILILSAIQGIIRISYQLVLAAHLILISKYYAFNNQNLLIDICLHLGSLIAIILILEMNLFNFKNNRKFLTKILIGTIPIIPVGYMTFSNGIN